MTRPGYDESQKFRVKTHLQFIRHSFHRNISSLCVEKLALVAIGALFAVGTRLGDVWADARPGSRREGARHFQKFIQRRSIFTHWVIGRHKPYIKLTVRILSLFCPAIYLSSTHTYGRIRSSITFLNSFFSIISSLK